jgi:AcrR family transcriptional regulator
MGVAERRAREKEVLRSQILSAASELFVAEGVQSVSMRRIAEKIEYAPSTIYLYFKDKEELLHTICREVFEELTAILAEIHSRGLAPLDQLRAGLRAYVDFGLEHPNHYLLVFGPAMYEEVPGEPSPEDVAGVKAFDQLRQTIQYGISTGAIRQADVDVLSQTIWMMLHGITDLLIISKDVPNFPWADQESVISCGLDAIIQSVRP